MNIIYKKSTAEIVHAYTIGSFKVSQGMAILTVDGDVAAILDSIGVVLSGKTLADIPGAADVLKAQHRTELNVSRENEWSGGFMYDGQVYDSRGRSPQLIDGAAMKAAADANYTVEWTLADDTTVVLDAAQVIALRAALIAHGEAVFAKYKVLKASLDLMDIYALAAYEVAG